MAESDDYLDDRWQLAYTLFDAERFEEAVFVLRSLELSGDHKALAEVGHAQEMRDSGSNKSQIYAKYREAIFKYDDPIAHLYLGRLLVVAHESPESIIEGIAHLESAERRGITLAAVMLGHIYEHGFGVDIDLHKAERYFTQAASEGYVAAELGLVKILRAKGCFFRALALKIRAQVNFIRSAAKDPCDIKLYGVEYPDLYRDILKKLTSPAPPTP